MPRGIPNNPKTPAVAAISAAQPDQYIEQPVRSREEDDAAKYMADFLKNNRGIDLAGIEKKLAYHGPQKPGWDRYWALDVGSRIPSLLEKGWRFVKRAEVGMSDSVGRGNTDIGDRVSISTTIGDGPVRQMLMEIPTALRQTYIDARTAPARATEDAIRNGSFKAGDDQSNTYIPGQTRGSALEGTHNRFESKPAH